MSMDMRTLSRGARFEKRVRVIALRQAGRSYQQIASQVGLSRTGVFDICKRFAAIGDLGLRDAPGGRGKGVGRTLSQAQELLLRHQILSRMPGELAMPEALWDRTAVSRLIEQRLGITLPVRTLALYLARWGFTARRQSTQPTGMRSPLFNDWLQTTYPLILARSKAEGGEIVWASESVLLADEDPAALQTAAAQIAPPNTQRNRRGLSMISALTNNDHLRWVTVVTPPNATTLLGFLRRISKDPTKKVFLIIKDLRGADSGLVQAWLTAHDDAIEVFRLP